MPQHFGQGQGVRASWHPTSEAVTFTVWIKWDTGAGPLIKTADNAWRLFFDLDGRCAYALGDEPRALPLPIDELRGRWAFFALALDGDEATLWIDEGPVDVWSGALVRPQEADVIVMQDAIGSAAHFAVFEKRLADEDLQRLYAVGVEDLGLNR